MSAVTSGPTASGLDGVVVAETALSDVDGDGGHLRIAGYDVEAIAGTLPFETVAGLLLGSDPLDLGLARARAATVLPGLGAALDCDAAMDALRAGLAHLASDDPTAVIAAVPVIAGAWLRRQRGLAPVPPDAARSHAEDTLRLLTGAVPTPAQSAALDAYLVTVSDHGMNASTFTARVVASTGSDLVSAVVAAVGALKGPLHGGAPGPVLTMLDAIGDPSRAEAWLGEELAAQRRIMGMGHRVYRVRDPRAAVLERAVQRLEAAGGGTGRLALARAVERAADGMLARRHPDRSLKANVEFYTAVLLDCLGLPREVFSAVFAIGRVAGWCAHVAEQRRVGRLIRPDSKYVGARASL